MSEPMVQVRSVTKVYERGKQKVEVLHGLTLEIPKGDFVAKVFQGAGSDAYLKDVRSSFEKVLVRKPAASRPRSREVYLVAKGFKA